LFVLPGLGGFFLLRRGLQRDSLTTASYPPSIKPFFDQFLPPREDIMTRYSFHRDPDAYFFFSVLMDEYTAPRPRALLQLYSTPPSNRRPRVPLRWATSRLSCTTPPGSPRLTSFPLQLLFLAFSLFESVSVFCSGRAPM